MIVVVVIRRVVVSLLLAGRRTYYSVVMAFVTLFMGMVRYIRDVILYLVIIAHPAYILVFIMLAIVITDQRVLLDLIRRQKLVIQQTRFRQIGFRVRDSLAFTSTGILILLHNLFVQILTGFTIVQYPGALVQQTLRLYMPFDKPAIGAHINLIYIFPIPLSNIKAIVLLTPTQFLLPALILINNSLDQHPTMITRTTDIHTIMLPIILLQQIIFHTITLLMQFFRVFISITRNQFRSFSFVRNQTLFFVIR